MGGGHLAFPSAGRQTPKSVMNASASEEKQRGKAQGDDVERRFPFCIKNVPTGHAADT